MSNLPKRNKRHEYDFTLSNGKTIKYQPWLVRHEQEFLYATEGIKDRGEKMKHIDELVSKCLDDDVNIKDLSEMDFFRLVIELRKKSKGSEHEVIFTCPHCKTLNEDVIIDLDKDVDFKEFNKEPILINDVQFFMREISRKEADLLINIESEEKKRFMYLVYSIESISLNDEVFSNLSEEDVTKFLFEEIQPEEFTEFTAQFAEHISTLGISKTFKCLRCEEETLVYIEDILDFFG